ncbi:MAG: response regulator [Deltaproteobacteria bacterium]|nr:response regulator [Deltaproteobacteria bacterium]
MARHTLLFVDDEENILKALARLFHRTDHEILTARSGREALEILADRPVSLILSDQRMPGMTGTELLARAREIRPEAVRIILTGYADVAAAMEAINDGRVYRFLPKPWDDQALLEVVAEALAELDLKREHAALQEQVRRQNEELRELNATLERRVRERTNELQMALKMSEELNESLRKQNLATIKAFASLLDLRNQTLGAHCRRVAGLVPKVCTKLGVREKETVQDAIVAALLHDIGKIGLPDAVLLKDPAHLGSADREEVRKHPVIGEGQIQVIDGLAGVARAVRHHHENVDGSGFPDGLAGDEIPVAARVIRVIDAYDRLTRGGMRKGAEERLVLEAMDRQVGRHFDGAVFNALLDVLEERRDAYDSTRERKVPLDELREGMILSRDLRTQSGILLVPKDEPIRSSYLEKIRNFRELYPTDPYAYVYRTPPAGA